MTEKPKTALPCALVYARALRELAATMKKVNTDDRAAFLDAIATACNDMGISQQRVASRIGYSYARVNAWCQQTSAPFARDRKRIMEVLTDEVLERAEAIDPSFDVNDSTETLPPR